MKYEIAAASLLTLAAQAKPQGPPGGPPSGLGPLASFPSCASDCWSSIQSSCDSITDYDCICSASTISSSNTCIENSSCSDSDKSDVYQAVAQLCANVGEKVTAKAEATWSATSGGSAWPTGWTTSAWPSGGPWGPGGGAPGWSPGSGWGPFGNGGPGNGWGPWGSGAWTNGPWTSWWGTGACPASTWSGWTNGPWASSWTTWTACTATTTATSVWTTTAGNGTVYTTTGYGLQLAQATSGGDSGSGAAPIAAGAPIGLLAAAGSALAVLGGALLL